MRPVCGLFGSLLFPPDRARIDIVAHRGPDGSGWREFDSPAGPVALGHRRLAIIDVSDSGQQPMADPSGRFHLVFNGEIYNYLELREELKAAGHLFRSKTDSEVLIEAFRAWGKGCLDRLLGMFAFLIWDDRDKWLFAARDRFGIKPLYVMANRHGIAFASEIKQLIGLPGSSTRMNVARVRDFLISGTSDHTAETMFEGVLQLQPGCCVSIDASNPWNGRFNAQRWYAIPSYATLRLSEDDAAERFRDLLLESVRMHLRSDVPVGSCLSGGLDSSSIVCLMADGLRREGHAVNTVSACYDDNRVDERAFIQAVVKKVDAKAHYVFPRAEDVFQRVADITWHQDEPFGSTSIFAQWCVFEAARQNGIKVMLDGQGADEQLAGYHAGYMYYMSDLVRRGAFATLLRTMIERNRMHKASFIDQAQQLIPVLPARVRKFVLRQRERLVKHAWLDSEALQSSRTAPPVYEIACQANGLPAVRDIASLCLALTFCSNLQMLLHWEDRNSMAHSIEARVPFLDHRLVEFSIALGNEHKIVGAETKRVLRRAMADVLPPAVRERRDKLGFATPENAWFRGPLRAMIVDGVEATLRRFPSLLNRGGARAFVADMLERRRPVNFALWRIVNIGIWGDRFAVSL